MHATFMAHTALRTDAAWRGVPERVRHRDNFPVARVSTWGAGEPRLSKDLWSFESHPLGRGCWVGSRMGVEFLLVRRLAEGEDGVVVGTVGEGDGQG